MGRSIRVSLADTELSVVLDLLDEENPESCEAVWNSLPFSSSFGHTVVSGGGVWIPTKIIHIGKTVPRRRTIGSAYFYGPMQILAMTYGQISESAFVNEFARVRDEDLGILAEIGQIVWRDTIESVERKYVKVNVEKVED